MTIIESGSYRKRILISVISVFLIVGSIFAGFTVSMAHAAEDTDTETNILPDSVFSENEFTLDDYGIIAQSAAMNNVFDTIDNILSAGFYETYIVSDDSPVRVIYDAVKIIGMAFAIIYGLIFSIQILARGEANMEMGLQIATKFILSIIVIMYLDPILTAVDRTGAAMTTQVSQSLHTYADNAAAEAEGLLAEDDGSEEDEYSLWNTVKGLFKGARYTLGGIGTMAQDYVFGRVMKKAESFFSANNTEEDDKSLTETMEENASDVNIAVRSAMSSMLIRAMMILVQYAIACSAYGLVFSFAMRRALLPLAVADVSGEGLRSPGFQFLKSYFSLYLEYIYFYLIAALAAAMDTFVARTTAAGQINTIMGYVGAIICIKAAAVAALRQSSTIAHEVMGARG